MLMTLWYWSCKSKLPLPLRASAHQPWSPPWSLLFCFSGTFHSAMPTVINVKNKSSGSQQAALPELKWYLFRWFCIFKITTNEYFSKYQSGQGWGIVPCSIWGSWFFYQLERRCGLMDSCIFMSWLTKRWGLLVVNQNIFYSSKLTQIVDLPLCGLSGMKSFLYLSQYGKSPFVGWKVYTHQYGESPTEVTSWGLRGPAHH